VEPWQKLPDVPANAALLEFLRGQRLKADDPRSGSGDVEQAANVSGITSDNVGVQLRGGVRNHSVHYVPGASAAQQVPG